MICGIRTSRDLRHRRVSHLTGTFVWNPAGEDIANIEDFVIDTREGRSVYTVVSFGVAVSIPAAR